MHISIIGTGYVGLVTGACFAEKGHEVTCVDVRKEVVDRINAKISPIHELGLKELLEKNVGQRLVATTDIESAVLKSEISFICVGTPSSEDGSIDLSYIREAARNIGRALRKKGPGHIVVVKSTVVPGTTVDIVAKCVADESGLRMPAAFGICFNPEFLREGCAVEDSMNPDRIVLGSEDNGSMQKLKKIYEGRFDAPIIETNTRTAEMIKYANNSLLSTLISFSNEIADICEAIPEVDAETVLGTVTMDGRINPRKGTKFLNPQIISYLRSGCGFGGSCFPKDVNAIVSFSKHNGLQARLLEEVIKINKARAGGIVGRIERRVGSLAGKEVTLLGAAFKPETDDIRESPSLRFIDLLLEKGARIRVTDPEALGNLEKVYGSKISYYKDAKEALKGAEVAILVTKWKQFASLLPEDFKSLMKKPMLFDGRRMYDRKRYSSIEYMGVGIQG